MTPEQRMWMAKIELMVEDAIYPFRVPTGEKRSQIDEQFKRLLKAKHSWKGRSNIMRDRAIIFLESEEFDETTRSAGYDTLFVNKTFQFVQEVLTLRKRLITIKQMQKKKSGHLKKSARRIRVNIEKAKRSSRV